MGLLYQGCLTSGQNLVYYQVVAFRTKRTTLACILSLPLTGTEFQFSEFDICISEVFRQPLLRLLQKLFGVRSTLWLKGNSMLMPAP